MVRYFHLVTSHLGVALDNSQILVCRSRSAETLLC